MKKVKHAIYVKKNYKDGNYRKVKGHCYFNGKYCGRSHCICNLCCTKIRRVTMSICVKNVKKRIYLFR